MKIRWKIEVLLLACLIAAVTAIGLSHTEIAAVSIYDYELQGYSVDIRVMEDNVLHITEKIHTVFNASRHGIYRTIPLVNEVTREDGSMSKVYAGISDIDANVTYEVSYENGSCKIKLGDKDTLVTKPVDYEISYTYDLGNDVLDGKDEFYFNIIGTEWQDTCISNVSFSIQMPKKFDENKLGFSRGKEGSTNYNGIVYRIDDNTITGKLQDREVLGAGEGLTVRLELPEGYFTPKSQKDILSILSIVCSLLALAAAAFMWYKVGRDDPVIDVLEFYPPGGLNSLETALLYKGKASKEDVVSLVVYLANKGYMRIDEMNDEGFLGIKKESFCLVKEREYDGKNASEFLFMDGLFAKGNIVRKSSLENSFYKTVNKILRVANAKKNMEKIFEKNSINKTWFLYLMMLGTILFSLLPPMLYVYGGHISQDMIVAVLFPIIGIIAVFAMIVHDTNIVTILFALTWGAGFAGAPIALILWPAIQTKQIFVITFVIGVISVAGVAFFTKIMPKRTPYGTELLGRIEGFKRFLKIAEKDRLEAMVAEDPNYFYDILPYAYVLGVSDEWMEKFESIAVEPPNWYRGHHRTYFNMHQFNHFMRSTMTSASHSMTSSPRSSGGGHSGGGSGGGGGGSW